MTTADKQQTADEDLAGLRTQVTESTKAKEAAESKANTAMDDATKAQVGQAQAVLARARSDEAAVVNAIAAAEQETANIETQLAAAMTANDAAAVAKATRLLSSAQSKIDQYTNQKARIDNWKKTEIPKIEAFIKNPPRQAPADPLAAYPEKSRNWLRSHPEIANNERKMQKVYAAHADAVADGIAIESPEYFQHIEKFMGLTNKPTIPNNDGEVEVANPLSEAADLVDVNIEERPAERQPPQRDMDADTAAPPSRQTPRMNGRQQERPGTVRLSKEEAEIAKSTYSWLKDGKATDDEKIREYAKNKAILIKEGRIPAQ